MRPLPSTIPTISLEEASALCLKRIWQVLFELRNEYSSCLLTASTIAPSVSFYKTRYDNMHS